MVKDPGLAQMSFLWCCCFKKPRALRENCLEGKWIVVEFDKDRGYQLALLFYLQDRFQHIPLHLICDSRKRSYQGWFWVGDVTEDEWWELLKVARALGMDATRVRPEIKARLPGGFNWNKQHKGKQRIVWMSEDFRRDLDGSTK